MTKYICDACNAECATENFNRFRYGKDAVNTLELCNSCFKSWFVTLEKAVREFTEIVNKKHGEDS